MDLRSGLTRGYLLYSLSLSCGEVVRNARQISFQSSECHLLYHVVVYLSNTGNQRLGHSDLRSHNLRTNTGKLNESSQNHIPNLSSHKHGMAFALFPTIILRLCLDPISPHVPYVPFHNKTHTSFHIFRELPDHNLYTLVYVHQWADILFDF